MTVAQLIAKLQTLPPNSTVLVDQSNTDLTLPADVMGEAIVVAKGVGYQTHNENGGVDYWVSSSLSPAGLGEYHMLGAPCVYIGSGESIIGPLWQKV